MFSSFKSDLKNKIQSLDRFDLFLIIILLVNFLFYLYLLISTLDSIIPYDAYDKGIMYQIVYNTLGNNQPFLSTINGAFDLGGSRYILAILMPMFFFSPTPLGFSIFTTGLLTLGALPLYWLANDKFHSKPFGLFFACAYLLYPSLSWLFLESVKEEIFVLPLLIFAFYFMEKRSFGFSMAFLFFACLCKISITFTVVMFGIYALLECYERKWIIAPICIGLGIFLIEGFLLQPYFISMGNHLYGDILSTVSSGNIVPYDRYSYLGTTIPEVLINGFLRPSLVFDHLFRLTNMNYLIILLVPVLFLSFIKPKVLIIGIPVLFQNLLAEKVALQQISFHYVSVLTFVIICSALLGLAQLYNSPNDFNKKLTRILLLGIAIALVGSFLFFGAVPKTLNDLSITNTTDNKAFINEIDKIPKNASVLCTQNLGPYFYQHSYIEYINPDINGGFLSRHPGGIPSFDYIVIDTREFPWPVLASDQNQIFSKLFNLSSYTLTHGGKNQIIFERIHNDSSQFPGYSKRSLFLNQYEDFSKFFKNSNDITQNSESNGWSHLIYQWNIDTIGVNKAGDVNTTSQILDLIKAGYLIPQENIQEYSVYQLAQYPTESIVAIGENWWMIEQSGDTRWRWMSNNGTIMIYSPTKQKIAFSFDGLSFYKLRTIDLVLNGDIIETKNIGTSFSGTSIPLQLNDGLNTLTLSNRETCEKPSDLSKLQNGDSRCLSLMIKNVRLEPVVTYNVSYLPNEFPATIGAGKRIFVPLNLQNTGTASWYTKDVRPIHISYHWLKNQSIYEYDGMRTIFPDNVTSGHKISVQMILQTPAEEGDYTLSVDLVREGAFWFEDTGSSPLMRNIRITNETSESPLYFTTDDDDLNSLNGMIYRTITHAAISFDGSSGRISGFTAGSGYPQIWVRDSATILPVSRFYYNESYGRTWIEEFLTQQSPDGSVLDYVSPGGTDKNSVETDQESSLVHSSYLYVKNTGNAGWLKHTVGGKSVIEHLDESLMYVLQNRYNSSFGLITGAYTADWGDVQFEDNPGTHISDKTHLTCDIYDNAMFVRASDDLSALYEYQGNTSRAIYWKKIATELRKNINTYLWQEDLGFYKMHIPLSKVDLPFNDSEIFALGGNVMAVESGVSDDNQTRKIFSTAERVKILAHAKSAGITLYPPYPKGFFANSIMDEPYSYQNGGIWDWFGGRLVLQEFEHGYSSLAIYHMREIAQVNNRAGNFYEWYTLNGTGSGSPYYTGSAGIVGQGIIEGYFGIYLDNRTLALKPRIALGNATISLNDSATGSRVSYTYSTQDNSTIFFNYSSNVKNVQPLWILVPDGRTVSHVTFDEELIKPEFIIIGNDTYILIPAKNRDYGKIRLILN